MSDFAGGRIGDCSPLRELYASLKEAEILSSFVSTELNSFG